MRRFREFIAKEAGTTTLSKPQGSAAAKSGSKGGGKGGDNKGGDKGGEKDKGKGDRDAKPPRLTAIGDQFAKSAAGGGTLL